MPAFWRFSELDPAPTLPAAGARVELVSWAPAAIDDHESVPKGTQGTVQAEPHDYQIWVRWDNGSGLALVPGDVWREVEQP